MNISSFEDLLSAARQQAEPQRLLFVFTKMELPEDCSAEQRSDFEAGVGGALTPLMCLDKIPEELSTFNELLEESRQFLQDWTIVFVAALSGRDGRAPKTEDAEAPLNQMVAAIKAGSAGMFIPFDTRGQPVSMAS
jgi:hypothetical protein